MKIIDVAKFKLECSKFDRPVLKALLWEWSMQRILQELVLVDAINSCRKNGELIPKGETLTAYNNTLMGERILINLLGRKEAAKVYGILEGVTSDVKMVDYILSDNSTRYQDSPDIDKESKNGDKE